MFNTYRSLTLSKLHTMLSKLNRAPVNSVVPPDIRVNVARDLESRRSRRKYIIGGAVCSSALLLGICVRIYLEKRVESLPKPRQTMIAPIAKQMPTPSARSSDTVADPNKSPAAGHNNINRVAGSPSKRRSPVSAALKPKPGHSHKLAHQAEGGAANGEMLPVGSESTVKKPDNAAEAVPLKLPTIDKEARDTCIISAEAAEKRNSYAEALRMYKKALTYDQDNHRLMNNAAGMHLSLGEYAAALDMSSKALLLDHNYVPALVNQGIARNALGNRTGAAESFTMAVELDPANRDAQYNLALFYERNERLDAAAQVFKKLAAHGDSSGMIGLARIYEKQRRIDEAKKTYADIAAMHGIPADIKKIAIERLLQLRIQ